MGHPWSYRAAKPRGIIPCCSRGAAIESFFVLRRVVPRSGEDLPRKERQEGDAGGDYMAGVSNRQAMVRRGHVELCLFM